MQEFFFKNYFVKHGNPDLMIMSMPHNHEKWRPRNATIKRFNAMMETISKTKSAELPLVIIPTAGEFENKRLTSSYGSKTFRGLTARDFIYKINTDMYPHLEPYLLKPGSNFHGFHNLVNMSYTKKDWNLDGVHYNYIWYNNLMRNILSTFCA
ncbi:hypothetical protein CAPTEDRAFT_201207 [Capitella teleta]|uniref:SGNH hydrolase-type esterase domain-containing protein n=1 Tax=Capitella teleta TaxID=283909 RepID=R7UNG0_CAPTE|nr:hypothetical protein CAPTEDRAFT_201207 [Capitella teleta]|eukprot:ELU04936.1 hypothetical protein CAPTEDRAFT_201207 [Capitella teleta]